MAAEEEDPGELGKAYIGGSFRVAEQTTRRGVCSDVEIESLGRIEKKTDREVGKKSVHSRGAECVSEDSKQRSKEGYKGWAVFHALAPRRNRTRSRSRKKTATGKQQPQQQGNHLSARLCILPDYHLVSFGFPFSFFPLATSCPNHVCM